MVLGNHVQNIFCECITLCNLTKTCSLKLALRFTRENSFLEKKIFSTVFTSHFLI